MEIRAGRADPCKQQQAGRGGRSRQIAWRKQQMFHYSTRTVHSAGTWKFLLGKWIFLLSEAKLPLSGLMLRKAELLTLAVFCCCISESQHLEFVFPALWMP